MDYRKLRQEIIALTLMASLPGVAGVSPVMASQKVETKREVKAKQEVEAKQDVEARQDTLDFVQQHYVQTLNARARELVTLFSGKALQKLRKDNDSGLQGKPLTNLDSSVGITLGELTDSQRTSLHQLLVTVLGSSGYQRLTAILNQKFLRQEMADHVSDLPVDRLPDERLLLTGNPGSHKWGIRLGGPWLNIDLFFDMEEGQSRISTGPLFMASYPTRVPPMSAIDFSQGSAKLPSSCLHWHEQTGQMILWQAGNLARTLIRELRPVVRYKTCLNRKTLTDDCLMISGLPDSGIFLSSATPTIRIDQLTAAERHYFKRFMQTILENWPPEIRDPSKTMEQLNLARLAWAGNPEEQDQGFYLRVQSETLLIELLQTSMTSTADALGLPGNATFVVFRDPGSPHDFDPLGKLLESLNQARKDVQAEESLAQARNVTAPDDGPALTADEPAGQPPIQPGEIITWLREPAWLEGVEINIGHKGKRIATGVPFYPVVRARLDGSSYQNMQISVTLQDQYGQTLIASRTLNYDDQKELYSTVLTLPKTMSGIPVTIIYSAYQSGSPYEGIYEVVLKPDMPLNNAPAGSGRKSM